MSTEALEQTNFFYAPSTDRKKTLKSLEKLSKKEEITDENLFKAIADTVATKAKNWPRTRTVWYNIGGFTRAPIGYIRSREGEPVLEEVLIDEGPDGNAFCLRRHPGGSINVFICNDNTGDYDPHEIPLVRKKAIVTILQGALGYQRSSPS